MGTVTAFGATTRKPPTTETRKVARSREHLTSDEVDRLMAATAKEGRYGHGPSTRMLRKRPPEALLTAV